MTHIVSVLFLLLLSYYFYFIFIHCIGLSLYNPKKGYSIKIYFILVLINANDKKMSFGIQRPREYLFVTVCKVFHN